MLFEKIKLKIVSFLLKQLLNNPSIDLYIRIVDIMRYSYVVTDRYDKESYELKFMYEDWTNIYNDSKKHMCLTAFYVDKNGKSIVKWCAEDFYALYEKIQDWNIKHRVNK